MHPADHIAGIEQQIVELVRKRDQFMVEGWPDESRRCDGELEQLYDELASATERATAEYPRPHIDLI